MPVFSSAPDHVWGPAEATAIAEQITRLRDTLEHVNTPQPEEDLGDHAIAYRTLALATAVCPRLRHWTSFGSAHALRLAPQTLSSLTSLHIAHSDMRWGGESARPPRVVASYPLASLVSQSAGRLQHITCYPEWFLQ